MMPAPIYYDSTKITPEIVLDAEKGVFKISGRSFPEDTLKFYQPILHWLNEYVDNAIAETNFIIDLEYFNSSSARMIYKIMLVLEKIQDHDKKITCHWYVKKNDFVSKERVEEMKKMFFLPINLVEK